MKKVKHYPVPFMVALFFSLSYSPVLHGIDTQGRDSRPCSGQPSPQNSSSGPVQQRLGEDIPDWRVRWELARLLSYAKRHEESIAEYEKLLEEKPDFLEARLELATVLFWSDHHDRAFKIFDEIPLEKMDDNTRLVVAELCAARKEYNKAESIYKAYLQTRPGDIRIRLKLAQLLAWATRYEESLNEYKTILKARPDDIQVRRKYAFVLSWAGHRAEAIEELRKTLVTSQ